MIAVRRQTSLKLGARWKPQVPGYRYQPDAIDRAEDRERFQQAVDCLKLKQPANATVTAIEQALRRRKRLATRCGASFLRAGRPRDGNRLSR